MTLENVRRALRSESRDILVEAAGGCGKTFEASELAAELGSCLSEGSEVLLLAHTNAAVQEFIRRTRGSGARVRPTTNDAFCVELLGPYAGRLGLPTPLRRWVGAGVDRIPFGNLAPQVVACCNDAQRSQRCWRIAIRSSFWMSIRTRVSTSTEL